MTAARSGGAPFDRFIVGNADGAPIMRVTISACGRFVEARIADGPGEGTVVRLSARSTAEAIGVWQSAYDELLRLNRGADS